MTPATFLGYPDLYSWLQGWLPIIFMGLLVVGVFALMRFMPKTRPEKVKPDAAPSGAVKVGPNAPTVPSGDAPVTSGGPPGTPAPLTI